MTKEIFASCIGILESVFGAAKKELIQFLREKFIGLEDEYFKQATSKIIDTFKPTAQTPFPLPVHFNEALGLSGENRTRLAINAVKRAQHVGPYRSVSFGDRALHEAVLRFGGWPTVCDWKLQDWEFNEKKFAGCYEANLLWNSGPDYLVGLCEEENSQKYHKFNDIQKQHAIRNSGISEIDWIGYDESIKLPSPEKQLRIGLPHILGIDFKDAFNISGSNKENG
jgi:hypothetical protein